MYKVICLFFLTAFISTASFAQNNLRNLEELRTMQQDKISKMADLQAQINALQGEVDAFQSDIDDLSGWRKGLNGLIGFNFNRSFGWVANPNPRSSATALNIGLTAYANYDKDKFFWHNKGVITESWQDIDLSEAEAEIDGDGLFQNGLVDILNISSLAGYKLADNFGLSGQAEFNSSINNFISPGTFDIGIGATWLPLDNLTVLIHPLNYHFAFSGLDGLSSQGALGAKVRADYYNDFRVYGKKLTWNSTLTLFVPYSTGEVQQVLLDPSDITAGSFEAGLFEYTWLNTLAFEVWKGIGVGVGFGLRKSDFEGEKRSASDLITCPDCLESSPRTQSYLNFGLTYGF